MPALMKKKQPRAGGAKKGAEEWGPDMDDHRYRPSQPSAWGNPAGKRNPFSNLGKGGFGEKPPPGATEACVMPWHGVCVSPSPLTCMVPRSGFCNAV